MLHSANGKMWLLRLQLVGFIYLCVIADPPPLLRFNLMAVNKYKGAALKCH